MKKELGIFQNKPEEPGSRVKHILAVVEHFNLLVEKKIILILGNTIYLKRDLWGKEPEVAKSWIENTYIFLRMKQGAKVGPTIYFWDMEADQLIGKFEDGKAVLSTEDQGG
ncbi:MAG: hypothetical protein WD431_20575 [Cyclobacteriaceae bacterium]